MDCPDLYWNGHCKEFWCAGYRIGCDGIVIGKAEYSDRFVRYADIMLVQRKEFGPAGYDMPAILKTAIRLWRD